MKGMWYLICDLRYFGLINKYNTLERIVFDISINQYAGIYFKFYKRFPMESTNFYYCNCSFNNCIVYK